MSLDAAILECTKLRQRRENTHNVICHMTNITKNSVKTEKSEYAEFTRMAVYGSVDRFRTLENVDLKL